MADKYKNFAELAGAEAQGVDYRICCVDLQTPVVVLAPHGGWIEPGSSQIAKAIAQDDYSFYCFEGLDAGRPHSDLHVTSSHFDEPHAVKLVTTAETVVAVHGRLDRDDPKTVWMGGRDDALRQSIVSSLEAFGFSAASEGHPLLGRQRENICNRGRTGAGVQLELPRGLRDRLVRDRNELLRFANAVRGAIRR